MKTNWNYTIARGAGSGVLELNNGVGVATVSASSGNHTLSAPLELHSDLAVSGAAGGLLTVSGGISGTGGSKTLTKTGGGTLILDGALTFSTLTTNAGRTNLNATLASASINNVGGILNVNADATY